MKWLKSEHVWGVWRREMNDKGELVKMPHVADKNGKRAKVNDARDWNDFHTAQGRVDRGGFEGMCFLIADSTLAAIDIDGSHTEGGAHNPLEAEVLELFKGTYAEQSPSGSGVHILFRVKPEMLPHTIGRDGKPVWDSIHYIMNNGKVGLEFYAGAYTRKYFTFTGNRLSDGDTITDCTDQAVQFLEKYMRKPEMPKREHISSAQASTQAAEGLTHDQIQERLEIARHAKNGEKFMRLYDDGNTAEYGADDSAADEALCFMLVYWLGRDARAIDEAFRASKLMRAKWDERHGAMTYGERTISEAIDNVPEVYTPAGAGMVFKYRPALKDDLTERASAALFAELYGNQLRYCTALGWLCWDGRVWRQGDDGAVRLAQEYSRLQFEEARQYVLETTRTSEDGKPSPDAEAYRRFAVKGSSERGINAMLALARSLLTIRADDLDADAFALNTPAGIVNLRTGEISPHRAEAYCTHITKYAPSNEGGRVWRDFLDLVSGGNIEWQAFLQTVAGMAAIGEVTDEKLIIAYGEGANGKTTLFNALQRVLGDYAGSINAGVLTLEFRGNEGAQLATLRGKRLVTCGELEPDQRLSVRMLKRLNAADNKMTIEQKHKNPEDVTPTHHICLYTNNLPRVSATDKGTWRRLCVVPFTQDMPSGAEEIVRFDSVLVEQAGEAIMQWILEGAREFCEDGCKLNPPPSVIAASAEYQHGENHLQEFLNECCEFSPLANVTAKDLYSEYVNWAISKGSRLNMSKEEVNAELEKMEFRYTKPQNKICWHGLRLKSENDG